MKATFDMLVFVKKGWQVLSTENVSGVAHKNDDKFADSASAFDVKADEWAAFFEGDVSSFTFGKSPKLSVYLFSIIAGPYDTVESEDPLVKNYRFPLRLHCRKSLTKWVEKSKEEFFNTTRCGIDYYEKLFSTKYPFAKLDQVFVPDYSNGAMENVGCVIYRD